MRFILSEDERTNQVAKEVEQHQDIVFLHVSCPHPDEWVAERQSSFMAHRTCPGNGHRHMHRLLFRLLYALLS